MEQMRDRMTDAELIDAVNSATPEQLFRLYNDMMNVNLTRKSKLNDVLVVGAKFAEKKAETLDPEAKEELLALKDEKIAMIPEDLQYPNDIVAEMSKTAWERFQQRLNEQELVSENVRKR